MNAWHPLSDIYSAVKEAIPGCHLVKTNSGKMCVCFVSSGVKAVHQTSKYPRLRPTFKAAVVSFGMFLFRPFRPRAQHIYLWRWTFLLSWRPPPHLQRTAVGFRLDSVPAASGTGPPRHQVLRSGTHPGRRLNDTTNNNYTQGGAGSTIAGLGR